MAKDTIIVTDKNFRITLSKGIRTAEKIDLGDTIEIDVTNLSKTKKVD